MKLGDVKQGNFFVLPTNDSEFTHFYLEAELNMTFFWSCVFCFIEWPKKQNDCTKNWWWRWKWGRRGARSNDKECQTQTWADELESCSGWTGGETGHRLRSSWWKREAPETFEERWTRGIFLEKLEIGRGLGRVVCCSFIWIYAGLFKAGTLCAFFNI